MINPLVSVIIPTFGRPDLLSRCIESVMNQTYKNIEIIVIDDNGKNTINQHLTASALMKFPNVKYIISEINCGAGTARNLAVKASTGTLLTFLDDDDIYYPEKIAKQVSFIIRNDVDICLCHMNLVNHGIEVFDQSYSFAKGTDLREFLLKGVSFTPMIMLKRASFDDVGGFISTPKFQDHTLILKLLHAGCTLKILDEKLFDHNSYPIERISNSKKAIKGYLIKHSLENKICIDRGIDRKELLFNRALEIRYIIFNKYNFGYVVKFILIASKFRTPFFNMKLFFVLLRNYTGFLVRNKIIKKG
ncbi:glycosyltransferase family 2 protein [Rosenbergiella collisarenosi]|uniref:glycosyltransferase family 2 protein n=1 Tax=Rosenbergiella collisarenosi TaxID=1544695 RepID=UPI001BDA31C6|nr:glycosyltransferase family 2 protein [Rosenbergiella collisarenosi]MBT0721220.1 glycosyltransferase family 2 protein [Rosenbergiella collisarenosi]